MKVEEVEKHAERLVTLLESREVRLRWNDEPVFKRSEVIELAKTCLIDSISGTNAERCNIRSYLRKYDNQEDPVTQNNPRRQKRDSESSGR